MTYDRFKINFICNSFVSFYDTIVYYAIVIQRKWRNTKKSPTYLVNLCANFIEKNNLKVPEHLLKQIKKWKTD